MPVYLLHGFRWPRPLIRIHIILQNLDDAAAEWLVAPGTTKTMLNNFKELFPDTMKYLPNLRLIEQYDPSNESTISTSQPYAYVADIVEEVKLGLDVDDIRGKGVGNDQWAALMELRDKLAPEEKVGWYVVVCGDEERLAPTTVAELQGNGYDTNGLHTDSGTETETTSKRNHAKSTSGEPGRLKKLLGSAGRIRGRKSRAGSESTESHSSGSTSLPTDKSPQLPALGAA